MFCLQVRQERRVAEKQRRLDGVARRKEAHLARLDAEREATRERTAMRLDAVSLLLTSYFRVCLFSVRAIGLRRRVFFYSGSQKEGGD